MKVLVLVLASVAVAMAGKTMIAKDFKEGEVLELCKKSGQFLLHPTNRCKYIRCTFGDEPWQDDDGNYKFYPTVQDCPYGTAVSRAFYGHEGYGYGSEGEDLDESRLCTSRIQRQYVYGYHSKENGYEQCTVPITNDKQVKPTFQVHGKPSFGKHGFAPQPYAPQGGFAYSGYAQPGFAHPGLAHPGLAHPGLAHPGFAHPGFAHPGFAHQAYVYHGYLFPAQAPSYQPKDIQYPTT